MVTELFGYNVDIMGMILAFIVVSLVFAVWRLHKDPTVDFNILDLLMENGRVSKAAVVMMGAFSLTSWMMIQLTLSKLMTEGYFGLYSAAWIAPVVVKLITQGPTVHKPKDDPVPAKTPDPTLPK